MWTAEGDRLLFGGRAAGRLGIWSVVTDGSGLTLVASVDPIDLDIHPGGDAIVAILSSKALANGKLAPGADVAVIELPSR